jgi:FAD-dependent urate hydroxylase
VDDVLVIDASQRAALVTLRELGQAGMRTCAVDADSLAPGLFSYWSSCRATVPDVSEGPDAFVDALLDICATHRPRVLITCHDGSIAALRRRREEVERVVALALAPEEGMAVAVDKARTLTVADQLGIRMPRGALVENADQAQAALEEIGLPAVSKPVQSWVHDAGMGRRLVPAVAGDYATALASICSMLDHGVSVLVQEWLPGDREAVSIFLAGGRVWARFAQRAMRTMPPLGGNSVLRESIPLPPDIASDAERLVRAIGLEGYAEVEFRRDANGRAALMEVNPRLSASVEIAVRAGVPFPRLLYDWANGTALDQLHGYRTGLRMRWLGGDVAWLKRCLTGQGQPDVVSRGRAIRVFAGDFLRPAGYDYMRRDDLRPAAAAVIGAARRYRRRRVIRGSNGHDTDVAVIGAGPYGLSISAHLSGAGVAHEVFGHPMDSWQNHMPGGMYLKSEGFASNLSDPHGGHTLERFCAEAGIEYGEIAVPISLDTFVRYGRWFQERLVPTVRANLAQHVRRCAGGFELTLDAGDAVQARRVVVATGVQPSTFVPTELRDLPSWAVVHSYDHREVPERAGEDLLVVGAGQSALEAATLAYEHGAAVQLVARAARIAWNSRPGGRDRPLRSRLRYPQSGLGEGRSQLLYANHPLAFHHAPQHLRLRHGYTALGPAGAWWLRPRFEGNVAAMLGRTLLDAHAAEGGVHVRLGSDRGIEEVAAKRVLAATGYRPDVHRLTFLDAAVRSSLASVARTPVLDRAFQSSVSDLYFVGYPAGLSFGPVMRFVFGADFTARRIARRLRAS